MKRCLALLVLVPFTACTPGRAAIAAGAGVMTYGGLAIGAGAMTSAVFSPLEEGVGDGAISFGVGCAVAGAVLMGLGIAAESSRSHETGPVLTPLPEPSRYAPGTDSAASGYAPTGESVLAGYPPAAEPKVVQGVALDAPEPDRYATPADRIVRERLDFRLSQQASTSARRGQCEAAIASSTRLAQIAPAMQAHLVRTDAAVAKCLDEAR